MAWPREDFDFTPWLADNLDYLSEIGLGDLELVGREVHVPGVARRLDILAETVDERRVAIENQYRTIDHDHLTRGLAYAVGLNARALVVIAEDHSDEFIAVADYLNRCAESQGEAGLAVFLVSVRLEAVAEFFIPRFEARSRPNAWRAEVARSGTEQNLQASTEARKQARREFWIEFIDAVQHTDLDLWRHTQPRTSSYLSTPAVSGVDITWAIRVRQNDCHPMLWIDVGDPTKNAEIFYDVRDHANVDDLDYQIDWDAKDGARACSINAEPISECGWATPPERRAQSMPIAAARCATFKAALERHITAAYQRAHTPPSD